MEAIAMTRGLEVGCVMPMHPEGQLARCSVESASVFPLNRQRKGRACPATGFGSSISAFSPKVRQFCYGSRAGVSSVRRTSTSVAAAKEDEGAVEQPLGRRPAFVGIGEEESDIQLQCDESGCVVVMNGSASLAAKEDDSAEVLVCDLSGCYFAETGGPNEFKLVEGTGWRVGYETAPATEDSFCAMVGAGGWSVALTANEFNDFCKLIRSLRKSIATMDEDGITGKDDVVLNAERGSMWMECSVPKKRLPALQRFWKMGNGGANSGVVSAFEVRFLLSGSSGRRQAEGYWPAEAVMDMLRAMDTAKEEKSTKETAEPLAAANA